MQVNELQRNIWRVPKSPWEGFRWVEMGRTVSDTGSMTLELDNGARRLFINAAECERVE